MQARRWGQNRWAMRVFFPLLCHLDGVQHYYCDLNYPDGIGCMGNNGRQTKKAINTWQRSQAR